MRVHKGYSNGVLKGVLNGVLKGVLEGYSRGPGLAGGWERLTDLQLGHQADRDLVPREDLAEAVDEVARVDARRVLAERRLVLRVRPPVPASPPLGRSVP